MTMVGDSQERVDSYLEKLRRSLTRVNREDAADIIQELRSHILEKAAAGGMTPASVEATLALLGRPEELAAEYLADDLLARAAKNRSPVLLVRGLLRWAAVSLEGVWVLLGCVVGYFLGASLILCGILKPIHARTAGLWILPGGADDYSYSLRLGFENAPAGGRELLGWWMVPLGLLIGGGLCWLTTQCALWCVRQYRKSHALHRA